MPAPMSLLQTVAQNSAAMTSGNQAANPLSAQTGMSPSGGQSTQQTSELMGVAQTGKEQAPALGGQAKLSSLGERLANINTLMSAQQLQQAGTMQATAQQQQSEAQSAQFRGQMGQLSQEHLNAVDSYNNQVQGMLQQSADQVQQMTLADDKSRVEQMGLMLRLGNDKYLDQLNSAATKARLNDQSAFQFALNQSVFAQETNLLGSSLEFRNYLAQNARDAQQTLANMDIDFAMQIATVDNKAAASTTMWSGIGTIGGAAIAAGAGAMSEGGTSTPPEGNMVMQDAPAPTDAGYQTTPTEASIYDGSIGSMGDLTGSGISSAPQPYTGPAVPAAPPAPAAPLEE